MASVLSGSNESKAKPRDFLLMSKVASLEYEGIARVLRSTGRLPRLSDLAKNALDDVGGVIRFHALGTAELKCHHP